MLLVGLSQSRTGSGKPDQALWQWRPGPGMHGDSGAFESGKIPPGQSACPLDRSRHRPLEHVRVEAESSPASTRTWMDGSLTAAPTSHAGPAT